MFILFGGAVQTVWTVSVERLMRNICVKSVLDWDKRLGGYVVQRFSIFSSVGHFASALVAILFSGVKPFGQSWFGSLRNICMKLL